MVNRFKPLHITLLLLIISALACNSNPKPETAVAEKKDLTPVTEVPDSSTTPGTLQEAGSEPVLEDREAPANFAGLDWPQWLGPDRTGVSRETGLKRAFPKNGPRVLWKKSVGAGFSAFSVVGDRALTMFTDDSFEYLICLDANTGKEIWKTRTGLFYGDYMGGNGPRSTPAIDGNRVFTVSAYGKLVAVDLTSGNLVWEVDFKKSFGAKPPQWGFSGSPLVTDGRVYVEVGGSDGNHVAAFDKESGTLVWKSKTDSDDAVGYSSPIKATINGRSQIVFFTGRGVMGVNPENGASFWRYAWKTDYDVNAATPVFVAPDGILISSGYGTGSAFLKIAGDDKQEVTEVWKNRELKSRMATPVVFGAYAYGFDASILKCIEVKTGKEMWKHRGYGEGSVIVADGMLIILGDQGDLGLAKVSPAGYSELASAEVLDGNKGWTVPALSGGRLYLRNLYEMICVDLR